MSALLHTGMLFFELTITVHLANNLFYECREESIDRFKPFTDKDF